MLTSAQRQGGWLLLVLLMLMPAAQADIYRSEDEHGGTVYSDKASADAQKVELQQRPYRYRVSVRRIIDGDTLVLANGEKVRLLGINAPEIDSRYRDGEPGGDAARQWLQDKLRSASLLLEYDVEKRDKYERQLAHLFLDSGEHINAALLQAGLATLTLTPPNLRYGEQLQQAQQRAEQAQRGIWAMQAYRPRQLSELRAGSRYRGWQRWRVVADAVTESRRYLNLQVADNFVIKIPKQHASLFPPLHSYLGRQLEVRGWLSRRGELYMMIVRHPSAIIPL